MRFVTRNCVQKGLWVTNLVALFFRKELIQLLNPFFCESRFGAPDSEIANRRFEAIHLLERYENS